MLTAAEQERFHAERCQGIFSTDVGPVLKLSRFGYGPLDVAVSKLGRGKPARPSLRMRLGTYLEPFIAALYAEETGWTVERVPSEATWHRTERWMGTHGDYCVPGAAAHLVECKTTSLRSGWGQEGTDQVPPDILLQCMWEQAVYGVPDCRVALLLSNERLAIYHTPLCGRLLELAQRICGDFWLRLQKGIFPAPDWTDPRTTDLVPLLYKPVAEKVVDLPLEALTLVDEMEQQGRAETVAGTLRQTAKAKLIYLLGTAQRGRLPDGSREVRRALTQNRLTVGRAK